MQTGVVVGLGSNVGDREKFLFLAKDSLAKKTRILQASSLYESEAWGGIATGGDFLNQVLHLQTSLSALELLIFCQSIEQACGRTRAETWGDRTLDIDLLYYGEQIMEDSSLIVPHPYLSQRKFVLLPLVEILPDFQHPLTGKMSKEMLLECEDPCWVRPFSVNL